MNIEELLSYCGLTCSSCPIYWATKEENAETKKKMRLKIVQITNEKYGLNFNENDITDCDGCRSNTGTLFSGCLNCQIRKCARERAFQTCADCPEYVCDKLENFYKSEPNGKIWLDIIRSIQ